MRVPFPDAYTARFAEFAEVFLRCRHALEDVLDETQAKPASGSLADRDQHALEARTPEYPAEAPRAIAKTACWYLIGACEQLGGLAALYTRNEVTVVPHTLVRSTLEFCSRVVWLLNGADMDTRLARFYLEHLFSAEQAKMQSGHLLGKDHAQHKGEIERYLQAKRTSTPSFPSRGATRTGNGYSTVRSGPDWATP